MIFFDKLTKYLNLKKNGTWGVGGLLGRGGVSVREQMFQMALQPLKENLCAKLF